MLTGMHSLDTSILATFRFRRITFRAKPADEQNIFLQRLEEKSVDPAAYFGGYSVDIVRGINTTPKLNGAVHALRRRQYKEKSAEERKEFLKRVDPQSINHFLWFGGWSPDRVLSDTKLKPHRAVTNTVHSDRSQIFKAKTAEQQQAFLDELRKMDEEPEAFFGRWSVEKVLGDAKPKLAPKPPTPGFLTSGGYSTRRARSKVKTLEER